MKKKLTMSAVLLMMTVMCCGCADFEVDNRMDTTEEVSETVVEKEAETEADVQEQKEDESTDYSAICGSVEDGVYTNDYFKLQYEPGQDFEFLDEKVIWAMLQRSMDNMDCDPFIEKQLVENHLAIVAAAENQDGTRNMVIWVANCDLRDDIDTPKDILEKDLAVEYMEQTGYEDVTAEQYPCEFLGEQMECLKVHGTVYSAVAGYDMYQQLRVIIGKDYYVLVCATSYDDDKTDEMFEKFLRIE